MRKKTSFLSTALFLALATSAGASAPTPAESKPAERPDDCSDGVVLDDGSVETGYGFVPTAKWGIVLQRFQSADFPSRHLDRVCVCWLRTRNVADFDYQVVLYEEVDGRPAQTPYATIATRAENVVKGKENAGRLDPVDATGVRVPEGAFYLGVRWDPSAAPYTFVCADHSADSKVVPGFQREDRAADWIDMLDTRDPVFTNHRAALLRAVAKPEGWVPPPAPARPAASSAPVPDSP